MFAASRREIHSRYPWPMLPVHWMLAGIQQQEHLGSTSGINSQGCREMFCRHACSGFCAVWSKTLCWVWFGRVFAASGSATCQAKKGELYSVGTSFSVIRGYEPQRKTSSRQKIIQDMNFEGWAGQRTMRSEVLSAGRLLAPLPAGGVMLTRSDLDAAMRIVHAKLEPGPGHGHTGPYPS